MVCVFFSYSYSGNVIGKIVMLNWIMILYWKIIILCDFLSLFHVKLNVMTNKNLFTTSEH